MKHKGLSTSEAQRRLWRDGQNLLPREKTKSRWQVLISQFNNIFIYILLVAVGLSFVLGEWKDALMIMAAIFINTIVGYIQEYKAYNILAKLTALVPWETLVIRDGVEKLIPAVEVVVGDLLVIQAGDKIPADAKLVESTDVLTDEAILTGESESISKDVNGRDKREHLLFMGTTMVRGQAVAEVLRVGSNTKFGQIAHLLQQQSDVLTPLQLELKTLSRYIAILAVFFAVVIWFAGIAHGYSVGEMLIVSVAVAISAVPEGLVVAMTALLALGMQKLLKKKALVQRLVSVETLGSVDVICTDKTGTLTEGNASVLKIVAVENEYDISSDEPVLQDDLMKFIVEAASLSNTAKFVNGKLIGGSINQALFKLGVTYNIFRPNLEDGKYAFMDSLPFHSRDKFALYLYKNNEKRENQLFYMGSPEQALNLSTHYLDQHLIEHKLSLEKREKLKEQHLYWSKKGYYLLGVSMRRVGEKSLVFNNGTFLGYLLLKDPLRPGVSKFIKIAKEGGIKVVMITGDHPETAKAVADQLNLLKSGDLILTGNDIQAMSDQELLKKIERVVILARVHPEDKWRIVRLFQAAGHKVAMTGDGINDAPAVKAADIGLAVHSGTEVTKEAADLILLDNDFHVIVEAIEEGRSIFLNLKKILVYLLSDSFAEIVLIAGALLIGLPLPLTAIQILWINLIVDGFPGIALIMEKNPQEQTMDKKYLKSRDKLMDGQMKIMIFVIGIVFDLILLWLFYYFYQIYGLGLANTFVFAAIIVSSLIYSFACKNLKRNLWNINIFDNDVLWAAVLISFWIAFFVFFTATGQRLFEIVALPLRMLLIILGLAIFKLILTEIVKYFNIARENRRLEKNQ
jgi:Ca2+-transporting ATPase